MFNLEDERMKIKDFFLKKLKYKRCESNKIKYKISHQYYFSLLYQTHHNNNRNTKTN